MLLQNVLGSFLGSGSVTVLRYASRIVQAIAGILLGSIVQVTLPLIAKHAAANDLRVQRRTLLESIQLLSVIGLPVSIWLAVTAEPLIVLLFERGQFTRADAALTGIIIQLMIPDVLLGRIVSATQTLFYANLEMRTPLISTLIFTFVNAISAIALVRLLGVLAVPIAVSLASLSNTTYMLAKLHTRFGPVGWRKLRGFAFRLAAASLIGTAALVIGTKLATVATVSYPMAKLLDVALPTIFGMCSFTFAVFLFRLIDGHLLVPVRGRFS